MARTIFAGESRHRSPCFSYRLARPAGFARRDRGLERLGAHVCYSIDSEHHAAHSGQRAIRDLEVHVAGDRRRRSAQQRRAHRPPGRARSPRPGSTEAQLAEWYRVLDLQPGADMAQIKSSYRQLMRKYHPDMHAGNPQKQKAATELSMRVTTAYNGLVAHIDKK